MKLIGQKRIPLKKIHPPQTPVRSKPQPSDDFIQSMKSGLLEPLVVRKISEPQGKEEYEVVAGHLRLLACQEAGISVIPANHVELLSVSLPQIWESSDPTRARREISSA